MGQHRISVAARNAVPEPGQSHKLKAHRRPGACSIDQPRIMAKIPQILCSEMFEKWSACRMVRCRVCSAGCVLDGKLCLAPQESRFDGLKMGFLPNTCLTRAARCGSTAH